MHSKDYLKPEAQKGRSLINAYGGYLEDHDIDVEVHRIFADISIALKKDKNMSEKDIKQIFDSAIKTVFDEN